jgi:hypothetical protein
MDFGARKQRHHFDPNIDPLILEFRGLNPKLSTVEFLILVSVSSELSFIHSL